MHSSKWIASYTARDGRKLYLVSHGGAVEIGGNGTGAAAVTSDRAQARVFRAPIAEQAEAEVWHSFSGWIHVDQFEIEPFLTTHEVRFLQALARHQSARLCIELPIAEMIALLGQLCLGFEHPQSRREAAAVARSVLQGVRNSIGQLDPIFAEAIDVLFADIAVSPAEANPVNPS